MRTACVRRRSLFGALLILSSAGCTTLPEVAPPVDLPASFSTSGTRPLPERWWVELDDPALTELVDRAVSGNFDLLTVWDRLAQAEAIARREGAPLIPEIDAELTSTRTELTDSAAKGSGASGRNDFRLGLTIAYEIDLWGRVRSARDAARLDAEATGLELHAAAMTLSAEVARTWYELVEQRRQLDILDAQIHTNDQLLELVTLRFRKGQVSAADVLRQRQLVESTQGDRLPVEARARVLEHQLATLCGQPAGSAVLPSASELASLPPLPATGLPADVIERRPDVRRAYLNVLAADQRLASALADRYPRLALSGSAAFAAEDLADLFDNWIATVAAGLIAPVIDGGRRSAEVDRNQAVVSQRLHEYGQAIVVALREVEDALVQEELQHRLIDNLDVQLEISQAVVARIRDQYLYGMSEYLDVLQALVTQQQLQRTRDSAQRQLLTFRIDLYRAIGGGWALRQPDLAVIEPEDTAP